MHPQLQIHSVFRSALSAVCLLLATAAFAQSDVTQPGDPIIPSSANNPGSEGVANAIDGQPTKYLNFDSGRDGAVNGFSPSGFVVTPAVGVTRVTGLAMQSANDAPERDPTIVTLEGSNDEAIESFNSGNWELITTLTDIPTYTERFQTQTFFFDNFKAYRHYRWTVLETATTPNGCCMQIAEVELLGSVLPGDVTQPGDPILPSSANNPGSEGVANAIDGQPTKYLNFDSGRDGAVNGFSPSGFAVSPSIGRTLVSGITIQSANDAPERDPTIVRLEGSNDESIASYSSGEWELITLLTNIPPFEARFQTQTFLFDNFKPYRHYRWTVEETTTTPNGCCMQVAEVEFLGTGAPQDVTQPGDPIIPSSANNPGSEGVANAIDNQPTKYLNFDSGRDGANNGFSPSGFVVTPSVGATAVIGLVMQSANDAPERDPKAVTLEGSNDDVITDFNSGTWETVVSLTDIPPYTARFENQEFYFPNNKAYKHYRWTVLETQTTPNGCCMQIAEVELLAATAAVDCNRARFLVQPVNTPVLEGATATFFVQVNGPWPVQWLKNGEPITGGSGLTYTTEPQTATTATNVYAAQIVGCEISQEVQASIFTPSTTKSIALNFVGGGANGAPTPMLPTDIAGIQPQAYWNNLTNQTGFNGDGVSTSDELLDSDNQLSTISVDFETSGTWGAGTGTASPLQRSLNGLVHTPNNPGTGARFSFINVPAGNHAVIVYTVGIPGQIQNGDYSVVGETSLTNYIRVMNSDEYNAAPGFYRGSSTDPSIRPVSSFVRFDNVRPLGGAGGSIDLSWDTATAGGGDRGVPMNGVQLILNAPNPGEPPVISIDPQPTIALAGSLVNLSVTAQGQNLTYQWLKNGRTLPNGGNISGATTAALEISQVSTNDEAVYSVAVFNPAGSAISRGASVRLSTFDIRESLAGYWKFDETTGAIAANTVAGRSNGVVQGTATWTAGRIGNSLSFDGLSTYVFVTNYPKAQRQLAVSGWVRLDASSTEPVDLIRNADGALGLANPAEQFEINFITDALDGSIRLSAAIVVGPNFARITDANPFPLGSWQHVVLGADGAQLRLYRNGTEIGSLDYFGAINAPGIPWLSIGARLADDVAGGTGLGPDFSAPNFLNGGVDDLAIWNRGLTVDEITRIYQAGEQGQALDTVVIAPPTELEFTEIRLEGGNITLVWTGGGTLQSTTSLAPPVTWNNEVGNGTFTGPATGNRYFRITSP